MKKFKYRYFGLNWPKAHRLFQYFIGGMTCSLWGDYIWGMSVSMIEEERPV